MVNNNRLTQKTGNMKHRTFFILAGAAGLTAIASCNQLHTSIRETFHPDSSRMVHKTPETGYQLTHSDTVTESHSWSIQIHQSNGDTIAVKFESGKPARILEDAAVLSAAEDALRSLPAFAGKTVYLCQHVHFYNDGRIIARVQHPENETYADDYTWQNGRWLEPQPVQLSVRDHIQQKRISLDEVDFSSVAEVYRNFTEKAAGIEGVAAPGHVYMVIGDGSFEWYPQRISGSRERYFISFKSDGSVDRFYRE